MSLKSSKTLLFSLFLMAAFALPAQVKYGFKTGLNFARLDGPSEKDAAGADLESWKNVTGFHIGMTFGYRITDNFGVRGEALYSKRGGKYTFQTNTPDASFRYFPAASGAVLTKSDQVQYLVNISNTYIDLPVVAFFRWRDFEIGAGAAVGFLVASSGDGSLKYAGRTADLNNPTGNLEFNLKHNYLKNDPGGSLEGSETIAVKLNSQTVNIPKTIGAYYEYPVGTGKLFKTVDFAVIGDLKYYLSRSLYFGGRLQFGLADVTNNDADFSKTKTGATNGFQLQNDKDINYMIQAGVGFSF